MPVSRFHDLLHAYQPKPGKFDGRQTLRRMAKAPKFVFSTDVLWFIREHSDEFRRSLAAAIQAGYCELPHAPMVVEYDNDHGPGYRDDGAPLLHARFFWLIDKEPTRKDGFFLQSAILAKTPASGWVAVVDEGVGVAVPADVAMEHFDYWGPDDYRLRNQAFSAVIMALLLHVRGIITRPPRNSSPKLDRAREKAGKPPITKDYVTVHIGYVTDRDGKRHDYVEGSGMRMRVHLRRGHIRNQACGEGRLDHKEVWINPVLVNYVPGVTPVPNPDYLVVP